MSSSDEEYRRDTGFSQSLAGDESYIGDTSVDTVAVHPVIRIADTAHPPIESRQLSPMRQTGAASQAVAREPWSMAGAASTVCGIDTVVTNPRKTASRAQRSERVEMVDDTTTMRKTPAASSRFELSDDDVAVTEQLSQRSLEREIRRLQNKIKAMSDVRRSRVRAEIHSELRDPSPGSDQYHSADNAPRTASLPGSVGEQKKHCPSCSKNAANVVSVEGSSTLDRPRASRLGDGAVSNCPASTGPEGTQVSTGVRIPTESITGVRESAVSGNAAARSIVIENPSVVPRKPLKLEKFDGTSVPLETFLAKLENASAYNMWRESDKVVFLRDSLVGNASQILWELRPEANSQEIIDLLRVRFGNMHNAERHRAELYMRRRTTGESTQSVYQDIRRLLALAFPKQSGEMYESIGKEAFLTALNDPALRIRVLDKGPKTLDETMAVVTQMESYSKEISAQGEDSLEKKKVRIVSPARQSDSDGRIKGLEEMLQKQNEEIKKLKQQAARSNNFRGGHSHQPGEYSKGNYLPQASCINTAYVPANNHSGVYGESNYSYGYSDVAPEFLPNQFSRLDFESSQGVNNQLSAGPSFASGQTGVQHTAPQGCVQSPAPNYRAQHGPYEFRSRMRRRIPPSSRVSYDTCLRCGQKGHWRNQCPVGGYPVSGVGQGNRDSGPPPQPSWNSGQPSASDVKLLSGTGKTEMYVDITIKGHTFQGLLDTGSQLNVCPYRLCKNAKITPAKTELYAANSTPISVIGTTRLYFKVGDLPSHADVVVSDEIDEFLLGCSFLRENNCELLLAKIALSSTGIQFL